MALLVALGIGIFVAGRVTRPVVDMQSIARQMSEGNFLVRAPSRSTDEIGTLGRSLNVLAARLREKVQDLEQERAKVTAILDGMVEGVVAVDGHEHVLVMNERARAIFGLGAMRGERKPFLEVIRNVELHELFRDSRAGSPGLVLRREVRLAAPAGRVLEVQALPLALGGDEWGLVMVLHDVTELRRLEDVRTEFVANVSHELRTPLTAIHGYLETLLEGRSKSRSTRGNSSRSSFATPSGSGASSATSPSCRTSSSGGSRWRWRRRRSARSSTRWWPSSGRGRRAEASGSPAPCRRAWSPSPPITTGSSRS